MKKGFTLIELLIVIAIIAILAAITITVTAGLTDRANDTEGKSTVNAVAKALEAAYVDNQTYPAQADLATTLEPDYLKAGTIAGMTFGTGEGEYEYSVGANGCFDLAYNLARPTDDDTDGEFTVVCSQ